MEESVKLISSVFITFSGNCKEALTFYQNCFGGELYFEDFQEELPNYTHQFPVVSGSLVSDKIIINGSDLVHNNGRKPGNHIAIYLNCKSNEERIELVTKLVPHKCQFFLIDDEYPQLLEFADAYEVNWVLGFH